MAGNPSSLTCYQQIHFSVIRPHTVIEPLLCACVPGGLSLADVCPSAPLSPGAGPFFVTELACALGGVEQHPWPLPARCRGHVPTCDSQNVCRPCRASPGAGRVPLEKRWSADSGHSRTPLPAWSSRPVGETGKRMLGLGRREAAGRARGGPCVVGPGVCGWQGGGSGVCQASGRRWEPRGGWGGQEERRGVRHPAPGGTLHLEGGGLPFSSPASLALCPQMCLPPPAGRGPRRTAA